MRCIYRFIVGVAFAGCTESAKDVEDVVTIGQGVYGVLSSSSDVAGVPSQTTPDQPVAVYRLMTAPELSGTTTSNPDGVYEQQLLPGRYELCVNDANPDSIYDQWLHNCAGACTFVEISDGSRVRADWAANLSGGWWSTGDHCPRR